MSDSQKQGSQGQNKKSEGSQSQTKQDQKSGGQQGKGGGSQNQQTEGKQQQSQGSSGKGESTSQQKKIGLPEWISFGIGLAIVLATLALYIYVHYQGKMGPPQLDVKPHLDAVYTAGGSYYLPIDVSNTGGSTAQDVNVQVELNYGGGSETISYSTLFLPPQNSQQATLVFHHDPRQGKLSYIASFLKP